MYKLFPIKFWITLGVWSGIALASLFSLIELELGKDFSPYLRFAVFLPYILLIEPVRNYLWKKVPSLNKWIFPDLNGEWDIVVNSNWKILEKLNEAAKTQKMSLNISQLDPREQTLTVPARAKITQTWFKFHIMVLAQDESKQTGSSNTLVCTPRKLDTNDFGFKLYYLYEHENVAITSFTDENNFFGACILTVQGEPWDLMKGSYFTNRNWQTGMNTAGTISFSKVIAK